MLDAPFVSGPAMRRVPVAATRLRSTDRRFDRRDDQQDEGAKWPGPGRFDRRARERGWRMGWDSNPRTTCTVAGFQDQCLKPLGHPSDIRVVRALRAVFKTARLWMLPPAASSPRA